MYCVCSAARVKALKLNLMIARARWLPIRLLLFALISASFLCISVAQIHAERLCHGYGVEVFFLKKGHVAAGFDMEANFMEKKKQYFIQLHMGIWAFMQLRSME